VGGVAHFSTRSESPSERLKIWNELANANWKGVTVAARSENFEGSLTHVGLKDVQYACVRSSQAHLARTGQDHDRARITLHYQKHGTSCNRSGSLESVQKAGDVAIFRSSDDYGIELSDDNTMFVADFEACLVTDRSGDLAIPSGTCLSARDRPTRLLGALMDGLLSVDQTLDMDAAGIVETSFIELLALLIGQPVAECAGYASLYRRSIHLIDDRLRDPELRTGLVAAELSVSERAIQHAFASKGETPTGVILGKRLDLAARELRRDKSRSITDIAFNAGLSSSSYFSRCFRARFGVTPRQYRYGRATSRE